MTDLFGYEIIRTLPLCQPFGSLMFYGKKETRQVKTGKRPGFRTGKYLLYTTKEPYAHQELKALCGEEMLATITQTLRGERTANLHGYALCLADLLIVRRMVLADARSAYVQFKPAAEKTLWILDFRNIQRIEPFEFKHGKQGVGFLPAEVLPQIKILE